MNEKWRGECRLPIPKGLRPSAQGWRASAYPGCAFGTGNNANGVAASSPTLRQRRYVGSRQSNESNNLNEAAAQSPRLARTRLPWVNVAKREQPQRGCGQRRTRRTEQTGATALRLEMFVGR